MTVTLDRAANRSDTKETEATSAPMANALAMKDQQICWGEVRDYPYQPDHQVELLNLQAEADVLLLQLQALQQKRATEAGLVAVD